MISPKYGFSALAVALLSGMVAGCGTANDSEAVGSAKQPVCSSVTLTPSAPSYTATPGQSVTWTANGACSGTAKYAFNLRNTNGTYTRVQNWSSSNQWVWNTAGYPTGTYVVEVLVSDAAGTPTTYDTYRGAYFTLSSSAPCTSVSTVISPPNVATVGTNVTFTNTSPGCTPEFRIVHRYPNGTYVEASPYTAGNSTWTWDTSQAPANAPGQHVFEVWVRAQGSTAAYQAYKSFYYTLRSSDPCTAATLTASPAGSAQSGTTVTLTGGSSTCTNATYRFIVLQPSGTWVEIQNWTSSNTAAWNTTLLPAGTYTFQVWVRAQGSTAAYETYTGRNYTLTAATPTTAPQAISGGMDHYCALTAAGTVDCWGYNFNRELGNPSVTTGWSLVPVSTGVTQAVSIAAGYNHTCALLVGGSVKCWGLNQHGQIGNGNTTTPTAPVAVSGLTNVAALGAGTAHTCAVLSDGTAKCWGYNSQGQLGTGTYLNSLTPATVVGVSNARKIVGGYYHTCALLADGTVRCWGLNSSGQLGDGSTTNSITPVTVSGLTGVVALSSGSGSVCALKSDHTIWCWGANGNGNLGDGTTTNRSAPVQVSGITTATSLSVNQDHACAGLSNGTAVCWGYNGYGQLGNGTTTSSSTPVPVSSLTNVASVAIANNNSCATLTDGTAACWGYAGQGGLGNGSNLNHTTPVPVNTLP